MTPVASLPSQREIAAVVFRRKWLVLSAFLAPLAACVAAPFLMPPVYEAEARLLVKAGREFIPSADGPNGAQTSPQSTMREIVDTVVQILTSVDLAQDVVRELTVARLYPKIANAVPPNPAPEDAAAGALVQDLRVAPLRLTNVIEVRLRNQDRQMAADALGTTLARFQERHIQAFSHSQAKSLEVEIGSNLQLLADVQAERAAYVAAHSLYSLPEQRVLLIQQRVQRAKELQDARMRDGSLDHLIAYLNAELKAQPSTITLQTTTQPSSVPQEAQKRLQVLRQRERELLTTLNADHPMIRAVRASVAAAEEAVAHADPQTVAVSTGINPLITTLKTQLAGAEAERAPVAGRIVDLQAALDADDARLKKISEVEAALRRLDARSTDLETSISALRQRLAEARVSDQLDRAQVAGLSVIQHPVASSRPVSPRKMYFFVGGVVLSLMSGMAAVLAALTFGNRFITPEPIERILGAPVLAVLPVGRARAKDGLLLEAQRGGAAET